MSTSPDSSKANLLTLSYWRLPNGYYRYGDAQLGTRKEMLGWFLQQIRDSSAPDVEILNKPAQKSTLLFPRTVAQIRGGTYTLETLLLR